jgi:hypothetical protein
MPDGSDKPGADLLRVDPDGKVIEWRCHYATDPTAGAPEPSFTTESAPRRRWGRCRGR